MKDFKDWGIKIRKYPPYNYHAAWQNLKTTRLGTGVALELPPNHAEFYDVSLGTKCNLECPFCYTNAKHNGRFYSNIVEKAKYFFGNMEQNQKPFQIAIGSEGEPTIHPEFIDFIKAIYDMGIVPNYTTNGVSIANEYKYSSEILETPLLDATEKYCAGVAVSANTWNDAINNDWRLAVKLLSERDININIHYIIKDKESVDKFINIYNEYESKVRYFVLLPLMPVGRSVEKYTEEAFEYFLTQDLDFSKIAFGAHFYNVLQKNQDKLKCWLYPPESLSKNLILDDIIKITASSFDKESLMEFDYNDYINTKDIRHSKEFINLPNKEKQDIIIKYRNYLKIINGEGNSNI